MDFAQIVIQQQIEKYFCQKQRDLFVQRHIFFKFTFILGIFLLADDESKYILYVQNIYLFYFFRVTCLPGLWTTMVIMFQMAVKKINLC